MKDPETIGRRLDHKQSLESPLTAIDDILPMETFASPQVSVSDK
jgi:hypothetical protein